MLTFYEYKNLIFRLENWQPPVLQQDNIIIALRSNKYIRETKLNDRISSFNFTREAFMKDKWDEQTTKARGLFLDTETGNVISRGYEKFFNIDEEECTKTYNLRKNLKFPVCGYKKENGFLGLLSFDHTANDLLFTTKSTDKGNFAEWFKDYFYKLYSDKKKGVIQWLQQNNYTLVFEICLPDEDPHIIKYSQPTIVLLDAVKNQLDFEKIHYDSLVNINKKCFQFEMKEFLLSFESWDDFLDWFSSQTYENNDIEGYVFEDKNGFTFKYKTKFYSTWKWFRSIKDSMGAGRTVLTSHFTEELHTRIYAFMKTLNREFLANNSIITIRNLFYANTNSNITK